jgi:hypothetical protein
MMLTLPFPMVCACVQGTVDHIHRTIFGGPIDLATALSMQSAAVEEHSEDEEGDEEGEEDEEDEEGAGDARSKLSGIRL